MTNADVPDRNVGDLISRQAAIDAFEKELCDVREFAVGFVGAKRILENVPSAQPEPKKGKWIVDTNGMLHCSNCSKIPTNRIVVEGIVIYDMTPIREKMKYCPECGADMRSNKA